MQRKNDFLKENSFDKETSSRIVPLNAKFEIISKKELHGKIESLKSSIASEKSTWEIQNSQSEIHQHWENVFSMYSNLGAEERINFIKAELRKI